MNPETFITMAQEAEQLALRCRVYQRLCVGSASFTLVLLGWTLLAPTDWLMAICAVVQLSCLYIQYDSWAWLSSRGKSLRYLAQQYRSIANNWGNDIAVLSALDQLFSEYRAMKLKLP